jgi:hypothetical protein
MQRIERNGVVVDISYPGLFVYTKSNSGGGEWWQVGNGTADVYVCKCVISGCMACFVDIKRFFREEAGH